MLSAISLLKRGGQAGDVRYSNPLTVIHLAYNETLTQYWYRVPIRSPPEECNDTNCLKSFDSQQTGTITMGTCKIDAWDKQNNY